MLAPNMLLIHPEAWMQLCGEMDVRGVLLDAPMEKERAPVAGMQTYVSGDVKGFVVGISLGVEA